MANRIDCESIGWFILNSKERVKTTLNHIEPDRVPIFELSINNKVSSDILGRNTFIGGGVSYKNAIIANMGSEDDLRKSIKDGFNDTLELYSKAGLDIAWLKIQKYLTPVFPSLGNIGALGVYDVEIKEVDKNRYRIEGEEGFWSECFYDAERTKGFYGVTDCIKEMGIEELERYVSYLENKSSGLPYQVKISLEEYKMAINSQLGKSLFIAGFADDLFPTFSPFLEVFMEAMVLKPLLVHRYMEITTEGVLTLLDEQKKIGVDGVIGANDIASQKGTIISPYHYNEFILPCLKKIVKRCHSKDLPFIKHYDGNINNILTLLIDEGCIDGLHSIESAADMDIYEIKRKYGKKITLLGNLDCSHLMSYGTKQEIEEEIKNLLKYIAPGGGYIFSSSNAIHSGISTGTFNFIVEKVREYGKYPINVD